MKAFLAIPTETVNKTKPANAKSIDIPHDFLRDMKNTFQEKPLPENEFSDGFIHLDTAGIEKVNGKLKRQIS